MTNYVAIMAEEMVAAQQQAAKTVESNLNVGAIVLAVVFIMVVLAGLCIYYAKKRSANDDDAVETPAPKKRRVIEDDDEEEEEEKPARKSSGKQLSQVEVVDLMDLSSKKENPLMKEDIFEEDGEEEVDDEPLTFNQKEKIESIWNSNFKKVILWEAGEFEFIKLLPERGSVVILKDGAVTEEKISAVRSFVGKKVSATAVNTKSEVDTWLFYDGSEYTLTINGKTKAIANPVPAGDKSFEVRINKGAKIAKLGNLEEKFNYVGNMGEKLIVDIGTGYEDLDSDLIYVTGDRTIMWFGSSLVLYNAKKASMEVYVGGTAIAC